MISTTETCEQKTLLVTIWEIHCQNGSPDGQGGGRPGPVRTVAISRGLGRLWISRADPFAFVGMAAVPLFPGSQGLLDAVFHAQPARSRRLPAFDAKSRFGVSPLILQTA
jgi:hypothetical protein